MKARCYLVRLRSYMQGCLGSRCRPLAVALGVGAAAAVDEGFGVETAVMAGEAVVVFAVVAVDAAALAPGGYYAPGSVLEAHRSRSCGCSHDRFRTQGSVFVTAAENAVVGVPAQVE